MNWLNLNISTLDSEEFLGATQTQRGTWLCLQRYCIGQENSGRIKGAKLWKDSKWQQVARVKQKEVTSSCDLWHWEGEDLVVKFYPGEKQAEVQRKRDVARENGNRGGRPTKTKAETETKPTSVISAKPEEEGERKENGKGREVSSPSPAAEAPCTIDQAVANAPLVRMSPAAARHWWHTRNSAGWTKSSASGGAPRRITSWQSDMATSIDWAEEGAAKAKQAPAAANNGKPQRCV